MTQKKELTIDNFDKSKSYAAEIKKLNKIFQNIDPKKKDITAGLIEQAAFMFSTLTELRLKVNAEGAVLHTVNGNGKESYSENPAQKSYNTMIKNYNSTIKQLLDLLPKKEQETQPTSKAETELDSVMAFIMGDDV